jgi:hypothetical protein
VAVVELKGAIAIAVVEHLAPSVFCVPEMSDSDHDAPVCGTVAVPKPTSKSSVPPKPSGSLALASPNERPARDRAHVLPNRVFRTPLHIAPKWWGLHLQWLRQKLLLWPQGRLQNYRPRLPQLLRKMVTVCLGQAQV